jgi:sugar phosphate isomerase/epimerase
MFVACSTLSFDEVPLAVAAQRITELGLEALEVGCIDQWAHCSPWDLAEDSAGAVRQMKQIQDETATRIVALNCGYQLRRPEQQQSLVEGICAFARQLGARVVNIPAPAAGTELAEAARSFQRLVKAAAQMGRTLCVETHSGCLTEDPEATAALLEQVPELGLTLDPSHYLAKGLAEADWRPLYPRVRQVHLRDAGGAARQLQTRMGQGDMPFEAIVSELKEARYDGALVIEYLRPQRLGLAEDYPVAPEISAARDRLTALLRY